MCENEILKQELLDALKKLDNNKTPANDEQTKEFYEAFYQKDLKKPFFKCHKDRPLLNQLEKGQKQKTYR